MRKIPQLNQADGRPPDYFPRLWFQQELQGFGSIERCFSVRILVAEFIDALPRR
jgi:hypothetical protein